MRESLLPLGQQRLFRLNDLSWNLTNKVYPQKWKSLKEVQALAISKEKKAEILEQYKAWIEGSRATILAEYTGLSVKDLDELRASLREVGAEFHVVKNTLGKKALKDLGYPVEDGDFLNSTAISFAFEDAPGTAKKLTAFAKDSEFVKIKSGYLGDQLISAADIKALADLPPLPVMRAMLLGTIMAPASQIARTINEPGRSLAAVIQARVDDQEQAA